MSLAMLAIPNLLAALAILLPSGIGGSHDSGIFKIPSALRAEGPSSAADLFFIATHLPSSTESLFECLDETALDEEDSSRVEDHGIVPLTYLDFEACWSDSLVTLLLPASPRVPSLDTTPILRC
jgi:hypothetical protein